MITRIVDGVTVTVHSAKKDACANCKAPNAADYVTWVTPVDMLYVCTYCDTSLAYTS